MYIKRLKQYNKIMKEIKKGEGIAIGIAIGLALGVAIGNIAVGLAIGTGIGFAFEASHNKKK